MLLKTFNQSDLAIMLKPSATAKKGKKNLIRLTEENKVIIQPLHSNLQHLLIKEQKTPFMIPQWTIKSEVKAEIISNLIQQDQVHMSARQ